ncbi:hypothetical protein QJS10_CPB19g00403 [Acorus calamus]|uniref:ABC transporter B family member 29, chloroplastic n=1 Tax=Acorus calamus TaxID=4465 RepID=A0AAV9CJD1_ACOCL|nr:hypothetical protein QJS10_CPB19g00403 [Acorus calamus]
MAIALIRPVHLLSRSSDHLIRKSRPSVAVSISVSAATSLLPIKPYLLSEWEPTLKGWAFSAASVYCLSVAVPRSSSLLAVPDRAVSEGLTLAALASVRLVAGYLQQAFLWEAALNSACKIRVSVFERVLQRDLGFFEGGGGGGGGVESGDLAYRITAEALDVADMIYALLNFSAMAGQMVMASPLLSLVSALVVPCMCLAIAFLGERLRKASKESHYSAARLSAYLNEILPSMLFIKANNAELHESIRFQRLAHDDLVKRLRKKKMRALIPQIVQFVYVGGLLLFCAGSMVATRVSFDVSRVVTFTMSLILLIEPIQGIGKAYNELKQAEPAIERLFNLTKFNPQVIEKPDAVDLDSVSGDIKFCGITFKYGDNMSLVLDGLNLHMKPGEIVALVGPSGGGKTTFAKLLLRLYDPLSVAENIGYMDLLHEIDMERVVEAAKTANADEFISALPEGYETNIGQRGSLLSGGQKQRLTIARALYQKSSILILDEATSALDHQSEQLVRQAVQRVMGGHTVLVIAHRLETVLMADRVFRLDRGKLEEVTHSSLIAQYNELGCDWHLGSSSDETCI